MLETLFVKQAIYNNKIEVRAYSLIYQDNSAPVSITSLFTDISSNSLLDNKMAFINFTYDDIIQNTPKMLPRSKIVIELSETIVVDSRLLSHLRALHEAGYKIALDDFVYREEIKPLLELAHIIKIDVFNLSQTEIKEQIEPLRTQFKGKVLAKKIETRLQFNECVALGFDYYQGFFLNKPSQLVGQTLSENKIHLLHLISIMNSDNASIGEIDEMIIKVPNLANRVLKLTNSAAFYTGRKFSSLTEALRQLGLAQIKSWVSMLMLTTADDIATDLMERTLIRAKMCELLARETKQANPYQGFTVGILSTLDSISNEPMSKLLAKMHLSEALNHALILKEGALGTILRCVIHYETANFKKLGEYTTNNQFLIQSYIEGIKYAQNVMSLIRTEK